MALACPSRPVECPGCDLANATNAGRSNSAAKIPSSSPDLHTSFPMKKRLIRVWAKAGLTRSVPFIEAEEVLADATIAICTVWNRFLGDAEP
jgi:hypothetical protein